ncbi:YsnF/AvaK domain-containing protein [Caballeronia sp. GAWG1-1]|uniref:YsnF/AvaK domain-containing protein n=1 Tax=Caballeronia sp. GAWG1-1 TaxID=2921742 RepID=UPI00202859F9|nr:YsnF/AvaK domain-containing protein [Caballeronia sp. GAWG1-1]
MQDDKKLSDLPPSRTKAVVGRLSVTEERLAVRIEEREAGSVRVRTVTHKELKEVPVVLQSTSIHVDRVPVYRFVDAEFEPRQEGDTLIVPVFEYVPVTEVRLMLKEKIRVKSTLLRRKACIRQRCNARMLLSSAGTAPTANGLRKPPPKPSGLNGAKRCDLPHC